MKSCVGCGYCCFSARCAVSMRVYGGDPKIQCPALRYDQEQKNWRCTLAEFDSTLGTLFRRELHIGEGCCSALFNTWRDEIPTPEQIAEAQTAYEAATYRLPKEAQLLLVAFAREWISGDVLWLAIHAAAEEIENPEEFKAECLRVIKEQRHKHVKEFMG